MHFIGLVIAVATAVFWVGRAARSAKDIADVANKLKNVPRRKAFTKKDSKRGIDLIDSPMEAATILMVSIARLSNYSKTHDGLLSQNSQTQIIENLKSYMQISNREADELLTQMRWSIKDMVQPENILAPMTNIITRQTNRAEVGDLSDMLHAISQADGMANASQKTFIAKFKDRAGLGE